MSAAGEENHQLTETPRTGRLVRSQRTYTIHEATLHTLRKLNRHRRYDSVRHTRAENQGQQKLHWADGSRAAEDRTDSVNTERRGVHGRRRASGPGPLTTASCTQPEGRKELGGQGKVCKNSGQKSPEERKTVSCKHRQSKENYSHVPRREGAENLTQSKKKNPEGGPC